MEEFERYRSLMFGIAYRMMGSAMEAEDIVQEAYLRYQAADKEAIKSHRAFLSTIVTRLCLDHLKSARVQRETYIGPWLPEPIITEQNTAFSNPAKHVLDQESISMAFLVLLEKLTPVERAVFLLREVFDYDYAEIAGIVDKSEASCRQSFSRAKKHIVDHRPRFKSTPEEHRQILGGFIQAITDGELQPLKDLLAEEVALWSDGGGKRAAATRPIFGQAAVSHFLLGIRRLAPADYAIEIKEVNGASALILREGDGSVMFVLTADVSEGKLTTIRIVANPDKLQFIPRQGMA